MCSARWIHPQLLSLCTAFIALGACDDGPLHPSAAGTSARQVNFATSADWETPLNLGAAVNAASSELQLGIAPNERSLYVSSDRSGTLGQQDLWVSRRQPDGSWGTLEHLGDVVNSPLLDSSPTLSLDGHYLYFASARAGGFGGLDCWRSFRADPSDDFAWQTPENLGPGVNSAFNEGDCLPRRAEGGPETIWFTSLNRPAGKGDWDIYTSEMAIDGTFGPATPRLDLNTSFRETRLTITGDGHQILFTSNRPGGLGAIDIWSAERSTADGDFCTPENLGSAINSSANDRSPSITTNGNDLYFTSTRSGGFGSDDAYVVHRVSGHGPRECRPN